MSNTDTRQPPQSETLWVVPQQLLIIMGLLAVLLVYPFYDTIDEMVYKWNNMAEYGYGYMIPFISAFLIWQRKEELMRERFEPTAWAILPLLVTALIYFIGTISTTHTITQYALVLSVFSLAFGLLGWGRFKLIAIPLLLLFLMIPLPNFLYNNLSGQLQLVSSQIGVAVIRLFDISVFLEGNVIDLGVYKLQVVEACSGLRYLFPLISLSFIAAYLFEVERWKRVVVFLSSIPITVLMNSFRIGVIGVLVEYFGIEQAEGFLHDFEGWVIFMSCMAILFLEMAILARLGPNKKKLSEVFGIYLPEPREGEFEVKENRVVKLHYVFIGIVALYSLLNLYIDKREDITQDRKQFAAFPVQIGEWKGKKDRLDKDVLESLKSDDYIIGDYVNSDGKATNLYIAYYDSQQAGSAAHSPRSCIPGGGWKIEGLEAITIPEVIMAGQPLRTNKLVIKKGDFGQLVFYWFQQRGRLITNEYLVKWYLFWDALTRNRTDGALVRLTTPIGPGETESIAQERIIEFARKIQPMMSQYVPD